MFTLFVGKPPTAYTNTCCTISSQVPSLSYQILPYKRIVTMLLWILGSLMLPFLPNTSFGFMKSVSQTLSLPRPFSLVTGNRSNFCLLATKNNMIGPVSSGESERRKELWKSISNCERQAVQLLINGKEGTDDEDSRKISEAYKLLSQSASLKATDPFFKLSAKYSDALEKRDASECEKILKDMKAVGLPPHIASLVTKQQAAKSAGTGTELVHNGDGGFFGVEEVDAGSTFSDTVTDKIRVKVNSFYDAKKSDPANGKYMFYYKVAIFNEGSEPVQVVSRTWELETCNGGKDIVRGAGLMNTQPIIPPGDVYNYESICPLKVFPPKGKRILGSMSGALTMCKGNMGQHNFTAKVGKFNFILPESAAAK